MPALVRHVHGIGPGRRRHPAHAHRQHVDARLLVRAQLHGVVDAFGDIAREQLYDGRADANGHDLRVGCAAEQIVEVVAAAGELEAVAGEDAECSGAMPGILQHAARRRIVPSFAGWSSTKLRCRSSRTWLAKCAGKVT